MKQLSGFDRIQQEIRAEIANAFGITAQKLDAALEEAVHFGAQLAALDAEQAAEVELARVDAGRPSSSKKRSAREEREEREERERVAAVRSEKRERLIARHEAARLRAEELRLHLMIQREAIGLREHRTVYAHYIIPPKYSSSK